MYLATVLLLMGILPIGSVLLESFAFGSADPVIFLAGKWFVFWGVGLRLVLAGLRQFFQPGFTAREIFDIKADEALPLVRELGVANFATGVVAVLSLWVPTFVLPVAISAGIFYGVAGMRHVAAQARSRNETIAMVSDLFIFAVLLVYVGSSVIY